MRTLDLAARAEAVRAAGKDLPASPGLPGMILTCLDARVDPAHIFGLEPGEASVIRNIGGRLTDATIEQIGIIAGLGKAVAGDEMELDLAVIHHTECGASRFGDPPLQEKAAAAAGIQPAAVAALEIVDPVETVRSDIAKLVASPLQRGLTVAGYVYDVGTGGITEITPATALGDQ